MTTRSEFADRYQQVLADRDAIEIDLQLHLARVFARQGRVVMARLASIRASLVTDVPLTAAAQFEVDLDSLLGEGFEILARQLANAGPAAAGKLAADLVTDPDAAARAESALAASGGMGAPAERSYVKPKPSGKPARKRAHVAPVTNAAHVPTSPIPPISSGEVFMGGFDDTLHQEMDGPIRKHTAAVGGALIGAAAFGTAAALHAYADAHAKALTDRLAYIGAETNGAVQSVLTADAANGSTFDQMADHVGALFDRLAGAASAAISRVEGTAIIGGAATIAARIGQVESDRMWVSQRDERVRADHWDADGQIVALNEPFVIGDENLDFPGDPSASPAQTANCRCYVVFVPPGTTGDSALDVDEDDDGSGDGIVAAAAWDPDLHPRGEHGRFGEGDVSPALTLHTGRLPKQKVEAWKATLGRASEGLDLHKPADRDTFRGRVAKATADATVGEVDKMTTLLGGSPPSRNTDPEGKIDPNGRSGRALADAYMARDLQGHNLGTGFKIGGPQSGSADEALARHAESVRQRNDTGPRQSVHIAGRAPSDMDSFPGLHASAATLTDDEWATFAGNAERLIEWYDSGADGQIDWGQPGSFEDCVTIAGDHLEDPEAFCATRYHDATGEWPGAHHEEK